MESRKKRLGKYKRRNTHLLLRGDQGQLLLPPIPEHLFLRGIFQTRDLDSV